MNLIEFFSILPDQYFSERNLSSRQQLLCRATRLGWNQEMKLYKKNQLWSLFCTDSANIFINPRPACRETEKGGRGEREGDTGITVRTVSLGAHCPRLPAVTTHWIEGEVPGRVPPHTPYPILDSLRLQRQISRIASNSEAVIMTPWYWTATVITYVFSVF